MTAAGPGTAPPSNRPAADPEAREQLRAGSGRRLPHPTSRVLLALDGRRLTQELLAAALPCCHRLSDRLDILLVNPPQAPTFLLGRLLVQLERAGVDYRLTSMDDALGDAVRAYVRRFPGIDTIVVDRLGPWDIQRTPALAQLRRDGYRLIALADAEPVHPGPAAKRGAGTGAPR
jgi:hypothetical protein